MNLLNDYEVHSRFSPEGLKINKMKKKLTGVVVTNTAKDTAVVEVTTWKVHRIFKKRYKRLSRYLVHNPGNTIEVGTKVEIIPIRPISKRKFWLIQPVSKTVAENQVGRKKASKTAVKKESK